MAPASKGTLKKPVAGIAMSSTDAIKPSTRRAFQIPTAQQAQPPVVLDEDTAIEMAPQEEAPVVQAQEPSGPPETQQEKSTAEPPDWDDGEDGWKASQEDAEGLDDRQPEYDDTSPSRKSSLPFGDDGCHAGCKFQCSVVKGEGDGFMCSTCADCYPWAQAVTPLGLHSDPTRLPAPGSGLQPGPGTAPARPPPRPRPPSRPGPFFYSRVHWRLR